MLTLVLALSLQQVSYEPRAELPLTAASLAAWASSELAFKQHLAPTSCRWCETNDFDQGVRSLFNPSLSPSPNGVRAPALTSDVIAFGAVPLSLVLFEGLATWRRAARFSDGLVDLAIVLEATFSAMAFDQLVKFTVARARPFTLGRTSTDADPGVADDDLSFFSGHTTFAFAAFSSLATLAALRHSKDTWWMALVGGVVASVTGVLRLAADKHWASDVLVGAAVGSLFGVVVPWLHRDLGPVRMQLTPSMNGGLQLTGRF